MNKKLEPMKREFEDELAVAAKAYSDSPEAADEFAYDSFIEGVKWALTSSLVRQMEEALAYYAPGECRSAGSISLPLCPATEALAALRAAREEE